MITDILFILPNIAATLYLVKEKAYQANLLYFVGYILMIAHNYQNGDTTQIIYFSLLEVLTIVAIYNHKRGINYDKNKRT
jgi:hypothetical protein